MESKRKWLHDFADGDDSGDDQSLHSELDHLLNRMNHVMIKILRVPGRPAGDNTEYKPRRKFETRCKRLLKASHARLRPLHKEQFQLLESGEFITELAKLVACMPRTPVLFPTNYERGVIGREKHTDLANSWCPGFPGHMAGTRSSSFG